MISADIKKYIIVLLSFLLVASIIFIVTLTYNVKVENYFSQNVQVTIVNAGDTEGQNGIYTKPLTEFTQSKYNAEKQMYYSIVEFSGKLDLSESSLKLREISFKLKSTQSGNLTFNINYEDGSKSINDKFSLNLVANQVFVVTRTATMQYTEISENCKMVISVIAIDEESIANPDNIAFAIYNLALKK
ncbi:MAG: hypothetical protein WC942_01630 [Clostridia bacterium]